MHILVVLLLSVSALFSVSFAPIAVFYGTVNHSYANVVILSDYGVPCPSNCYLKLFQHEA